MILLLCLDELESFKTDKQKTKETNEKAEGVTVEIPKNADSELESKFFQTKDITQIEDRVECNIDDFDEIFLQANNM